MITTTAKGRKLERIIAMIEEFNHPHSVVELNMPIWDAAAEENRDFDVTRHETKGGAVLAAIECKDHARPIGVGVIDGLKSKAADCNVDNVAIVSTSGFSKPAVRKCIAHGIFPLVMHNDGSVQLPGWFIPEEMLFLHTKVDVTRIDLVFADGKPSPKIKGVRKDKPFLKLANGTKLSILGLGMALHRNLPSEQQGTVGEVNGSLQFEKSDAPTLIRGGAKRLISRVDLTIAHKRQEGRSPLAAHALRTLEGEEQAFAIVSEPFGPDDNRLRLAMMFLPVKGGGKLVARLV